MTSKTQKDFTSERFLAIRVVMMPKHTNYMGSIFGGHILSLIDLAAGEHCNNIAPHKYVTKVMREVNFIAPVSVGDTVSFYTSTIKIGLTSVIVKVDVDVLRRRKIVESIHVTSAEIVMVAVDEENRPVPVLLGKPKSKSTKSRRTKA